MALRHASRGGAAPALRPPPDRRLAAAGAVQLSFSCCVAVGLNDWSTSGLHANPPPSICRSSGYFGVVLTCVEVKRWGPHLVMGDLPVGPFHDVPVPLHEHGEITATSARALGLSQHDTPPRPGRPQQAVTIGRQDLVRQRTAPLANRLRNHFFCIDPQLQLGRPPGPWRQHADPKSIQHPITLWGSGHRCRQFEHTPLTRRAGGPSPPSPHSRRVRRHQPVLESDASSGRFTRRPTWDVHHHGLLNATCTPPARWPRGRTGARGRWRRNSSRRALNAPARLRVWAGRARPTGGRRWLLLSLGPRCSPRVGC